ncbi:MAG: hypothetical protein R2851_25800 [Caldilineaceae bacterium]
MAADVAVTPAGAPPRSLAAPATGPSGPLTVLTGAGQCVQPEVDHRLGAGENPLAAETGARPHAVTSTLQTPPGTVVE